MADNTSTSSPGPAHGGAGEICTDPVRERRALVAKWNRLASRIGYLLYLLAVVMFFVALLTRFSAGKVTIITTSLIVGSLLLAPAIVIGYAVKAAEKDDIARGL